MATTDEKHDDHSMTTARDEEQGFEKTSREDSDAAPPTQPEQPAPDPTKNPWHPSQFPDGGAKAWLVVLGCFCFIFCSFGWINCIGIFQNYYQENYLSNYSPGDISWIASLELFVMFAGGLVVGRIYDTYGPRWLFVAGTLIHVFGLMMTSLATEYYQILLAQGICSPIGISCLFTPAVNCVSTWFLKKRGYAVGVSAAGSSLGGVIFPIMFQRLIPQIGFPWAMRVCAFLILGMLSFACVVTSSRIPPQPRPFTLKQYGKPFTKLPYLLTTISAFLFYLGLFLPINYIEAQAIELGMSTDLAGYLIPILNAASLFGRIGPGWIGDRIGRYNTLIAMGFLSGILCLALWLPARGNAPIIVFAATYGFSSGAFVSLLPAMIAQISDIKEIGICIGVEFATLSIPLLVSNPIGGAFISHDQGGYTDLQIWTGIILLAGSAMFVAARCSLSGFKLVSVV